MNQLDWSLLGTSRASNGDLSKTAKELTEKSGSSGMQPVTVNMVVGAFPQFPLRSPHRDAPGWGHEGPHSDRYLTFYTKGLEKRE